MIETKKIKTGYIDINVPITAKIINNSEIEINQDNYCFILTINNYGISHLEIYVNDYFHSEISFIDGYNHIRIQLIGIVLKVCSLELLVFVD